LCIIIHPSMFLWKREGIPIMSYNARILLTNPPFNRKLELARSWYTNQALMKVICLGLVYHDLATYIHNMTLSDSHNSIEIRICLHVLVTFLVISVFTFATGVVCGYYFVRRRYKQCSTSLTLCSRFWDQLSYMQYQKESIV
jgi:hypothetical protein